MLRPGREYWAVPAQRRCLRTSLTLTGQGAITLHCLQRTPDQTITLSGSQPAQMAPKGSDSTDKGALEANWPLRGERSRATREQTRYCILQTSFLQFLYIRWAVSPAASLASSSHSQLVRNYQGARNSSRKSNGNVLSSIPTVWHCDYGRPLDSL